MTAPPRTDAARRARGLRWRAWNNALHRDLGYLICALTVAYGVSGIAVNHIDDWNPSFRIDKEERSITPIAARDREAIIAEARAALGLEAPSAAHRPDPETLQLFYEGGLTVGVDLPTGKVVIERTRPRPVLRELNDLHLNNPKGVWTWIADAYAAMLIVVAITGLFVLKGRYGITGRGAWLTAAGTLVPVGFLVWWKLLP